MLRDYVCLMMMMYKELYRVTAVFSQCLFLMSLLSFGATWRWEILILTTCRLGLSSRWRMFLRGFVRAQEPQMEKYHTSLKGRWNHQEFTVRFLRSQTVVCVFKVNRMQLWFLHYYIRQKAWSACYYFEEHIKKCAYTTMLWSGLISLNNIESSLESYSTIPLNSSWNKNFCTKGRFCSISSLIPLLTWAVSLSLVKKRCPSPSYWL